MKWHKLVKADYREDIKQEKIFDAAVYILELIEDARNYLAKLENSTESTAVGSQLEFIKTQAELIKNLSKESE